MCKPSKLVDYFLSDLTEIIIFPPQTRYSQSLYIVFSSDFYTSFTYHVSFVLNSAAGVTVFQFLRVFCSFIEAVQEGSEASFQTNRWQT